MFAIQQNFAIFNDLDGTPLQNGAIYFGSPNLNPETTPVVVYWDFAGTQPASQPLQTVNGIIARDGTPSNVYINQDYSVTVRNKKGAIVYSLPTSNAAALNPVSNYSTQVVAQAASIDASVLFITVGGYAAVNDGGDARYASVANTGGLTSYQFQSNGGTRRWQLIPQNGNIKAEQIGVVGNASDTGILQIADAAAAALGVELLIDKIHTLGSNLTFTNPVTFVKGGKLVPATNVLVNFSAAGFQAPVHYRIFDFSATGSGFTTAEVTGRELYPEMFGAIPNSPSSSAVNTAMLQAWFAAIAASGLEGVMPNVYNVGGQLTYDFGTSNFGVTIRGYGGKSRFIFDSGIASPNLKITSSAPVTAFQSPEFYGKLSDFQVAGTPVAGAYPATVLQFGEVAIVQTGIAAGGSTIYFNELQIDGLVVNNGTAGGWGTLFTGFANCDVRMTSDCNSNPPANDGSAAWVLINCAYNRFMGAPGSAASGLYVPSSAPGDAGAHTNICYANTFEAVDWENLFVCVTNRSTSFSNNTFNGTLVVPSYLVDSIAGQGNVIAPGSQISTPAVTTFTQSTSALGLWGGFGFTINQTNSEQAGFLQYYGSTNSLPAGPANGSWYVNLYGQNYNVTVFSSQPMTINVRDFFDRTSAGAEVGLTSIVGNFHSCTVLVKAGQSIQVNSTGIGSWIWKNTF